MKVSAAPLRSSLILLIVTVFLLKGGVTWAQSSTLNFEKATLVSKFLKHVRWPAEDRQSEFIVGVYNDAAKYEYFSDFFAGKGVKGKDIVVRLIKEVDDAKGVDILYISSSSSNKRNTALLANKIRGSHVLLITEDKKVGSEIMVDIGFSKERSRMSFEVYYPNITKEKLFMPDLDYFMDEKNNQNILSPSPTFVLETEKEQQLIKLKKLETELAKKEEQLEQLKTELKLGEENSENKNVVLAKYSKRLKDSQQLNTQKNKEIKALTKKLQGLEKQVTSLKTNTNVQNVAAVDDEKLKAQEQIITDLTANLEKQKKITNNTATKLTNITEENNTLSSYKLLFYILFILLVIVLIAVYLMWNKVKASSLNNSAPAESEPAGNEGNQLLSIREEQLIKSENVAALGYVASDLTYSIGLTLSDFNEQLVSENDVEKAKILKPIVTLLDNFNLIAADQDETDIQNFDLISYAQKMMMLYDFEFDQSDIVYSYSGEKELMIKSVPSYIALVLLNLLNNSLKHGFDNNGNGKINLKIEKSQKGGAKITYIDDGKGMSKSTQDQIFKPFFTTRSDRGYVGIGMSTTYDLIKNKLAGDIEVKSQEGKGTSIIITLP